MGSAPDRAAARRPIGSARRLLGNRTFARALGARRPGAPVLARVTPEQIEARAEQIYVGEGRPQPQAATDAARRAQAAQELQAVEQLAAAIAAGPEAQDDVANYLSAERAHYLTQFRGRYGATIAHHPNTGHNWDSGALRCLFDFSARLEPLVHANYGALMRLALWIQDPAYGGQAAYHERAERLLQHRAVFDTDDFRIDVAPGDWARYRQMLTHMLALPQYARRAFRSPAYLDPVIAPRKLMGREVLAKVADAADMTRALTMLAAVIETGGFASLVTPDTVRGLEPVFQACEPGTWEGFDGWGGGNHGTPESNMLEHFLKHVLRDHAPGEHPPPAEERRMWWESARLRISLAEAIEGVDVKLLGGFDLASAFGANWQHQAATIVFDARDDGRLDLLTRMSQLIPTVANNVYRRLGGRYTSYALRQSKDMATVQVHLSQGDYFVSGAAGSLYMVGRVIDGQRLLSAAYWTTNPVEKTEAASRQRLWMLSNA